MTVRAADDAPRDLVTQHGLRDAAPRQRGDVAALLADMVELEDDEVVFLAVGAGRALERRQHDCDVARHLGPPGAWLGAPVPRRAPPSSTRRGAPAMTVRAHDLTRCDLAVEARNRRATKHEGRDLRVLLAHVIELQHDKVARSAIRTLRSREERAHMVAGTSAAAGLRGTDLIAVSGAARREVLAKAPATPMLTTRAPAAEHLDREQRVTAAAPLHLRDAAHAQPDSAERLCRKLVHGRWYVPNPDRHRALRHPDLPRDLADRESLTPKRSGGSALVVLRSGHEHMFATSADVSGGATPSSARPAAARSSGRAGPASRRRRG